MGIRADEFDRDLRRDDRRRADQRIEIVAELRVHRFTSRGATPSRQRFGIAGG
jgi:hypothetical protein